MAAIFNGSTSDLSASVSATALQYPILVTAWIKAAVADANLTIAALSDDGAGDSLDALALSARGDQSGDPVWATATAEGSSSSAATPAPFEAPSGGPVPWWQFVAALYTSASSRKVFIDRQLGWTDQSIDWGTPDLTVLNVDDFTRISIGSLHNSGAGTRFNGRIAEVAIWTSFAANFATLTVRQLCAGLSPQNVWHQSAPYLYQPLRGGVNETAAGWIGPSLTASNVVFDNSDMPFSQADRPALTGYPQDVPIGAPYRWPDGGSTPGPLPPNRICTLDSESRIQLATDSDEFWIGSTQAGRHPAWTQRVNHRSSGALLQVEKASGAAFDVGSSIAYIAAGGKADDAGTVAIGLVVKVHAESVEVLSF